MDDVEDKMAGYIRAGSDLKLLDSALTVTTHSPKCAYLDLLTEDGRLRLTISEAAAEDLMVDIQQFLNARPAAPG